MSARWKNQDSQAQLEEQRYENPIPSRVYIIDTLEDLGVPTSHKKLCKAFGIKDQKQQNAVEYRLKAMLKDGQISKNKKRCYSIAKDIKLIKGTVQAKKEGHGLFVPETNGKNLYISSKAMLNLFDGDIILARCINKDYKNRAEAIPVEILKRGIKQIVGKYYNNKYNDSYIIAENKCINRRINIKDGDITPNNGEFVLADIIEYPDEFSETSAVVIEVLGYQDKPRIEIDIAIRENNIPFQWSETVIKESNNISEKIKQQDIRERIDLRDLPFVTIDGEDSKDFDDAIFCSKKKSGGWRLYVAIADVSHYVKVNSSLDVEAETRGNSVYFPDYVIPMLPEKLSNVVCSLNPKKDRLVMVCEITISEQGRFSGYQFYEAIIHSKARLTYTQAFELINNQPNTKNGLKKFAHVAAHIQEFYKFYTTRIQERNRKGAIQFDTIETRIIFNKQKKIRKIVPIVRNDAHKMIEEAMLCANIAAAKILLKNDIVSLYRSHASINPEKQRSLAEFLGGLGINISKTKKLSVKDIALLLTKAQKREDFKIIQTVILRSMSAAEYSEVNIGHFGLGFKSYTHFTSPIRRYPDLLVHRAIKQLIRGRKQIENVIKIPDVPSIDKKNNYPYKTTEIHNLGSHCSNTERRADIATRNTLVALKCEYAQKHIGSIFKGTVVTVTGFGLFIELDDILIEGLLHISKLPGSYYRFDKNHHKLIENKGNKVFKLGSKLEVIISKVDLEMKLIDLQLKENISSDKKKKSRVTKKAKRKNK
jgi:ribonuclease R